MTFFPGLPYAKRRGVTKTRAWEPLSDAEWFILNPFVFRATAGRPVEQPRRRLDAVFWLAAQPATTRWADLPERFGKPDTVSRQFRRWAAQGLWTRLLQALADRDYPGHATLRKVASWICRAYRRAWRILGLAGIVLAKRLGFLSALRGPPWLLPDPDLSELVFHYVDPALHLMRTGRWRGIITRDWLRNCRALLRTAQGRSIPRALRWP